MAGWAAVMQNSQMSLRYVQHTSGMGYQVGSQRLAYEYYMATQSAVLDAIRRAQDDYIFVQSQRKKHVLQRNCATNRQQLAIHKKIQKSPMRRIKRLFSQRRIYCSC
jgi:hypothetical protein